LKKSKSQTAKKSNSEKVKQRKSQTAKKSNSEKGKLPKRQTAKQLQKVKKSDARRPDPLQKNGNRQEFE
jgi:hypothetical protein